MCETFILLRPETEGVQSIVEAVEMAAGRVLLSFPPFAVVALVPSERLDELRTNPAILLVSAKEIADDRLEAASSTTRMAAAAWNEHLARRHRPPEHQYEGSSWGAAGRLAPDPPPDIQAMLRRREQELRNDAG